MTAWWGEPNLHAGRQKWIRRADAFVLAARNNAAAIPDLLAILETSAEGPVLVRALADREPVIRGIVALRIGQAAAKPELVRALADPVATVRIVSDIRAEAE
jgi:HEAT repeat protein